MRRGACLGAVAVEANFAGPAAAVVEVVAVGVAGSAVFGKAAAVVG